MLQHTFKAITVTTKWESIKVIHHWISLIYNNVRVYIQLRFKHAVLDIHLSYLGYLVRTDVLGVSCYPDRRGSYFCCANKTGRGQYGYELVPRYEPTTYQP